MAPGHLHQHCKDDRRGFSGCRGLKRISVQDILHTIDCWATHRTVFGMIVPSATNRRLWMLSWPAMHQAIMPAGVLSSLLPDQGIFISSIYRATRRLSEMLCSSTEDLQDDIMVGNGAGAILIWLTSVSFTLMEAAKGWYASEPAAR